MSMNSRPYYIIGLIGKIGSGKSTVASILVEDYGFTKIAFADPLKQMLVKAEIIKPEELEQKTPFARQMLQKIGTNLIRNQIDPNFWVRLCNQKIQMLLSQGIDKIVIDDVRFPNEAQLIKTSGGILVKIINLAERPTNEFDLHESESYTDELPYDFIIKNDPHFGLFWLKQKIYDLLCQI